MAEEMRVGSTSAQDAVIRHSDRFDHIYSDKEKSGVEADDFLIKKGGVSLSAIRQKTRHLARRVHEKEACYACYGTLRHALTRLDEAGGLPEVDIHIGQGYKKTAGTGPGVGIGSCLSNFTAHLPGCPPSGADIRRFPARFSK